MSHSSYVWRPDFDALTATGHDAEGKPTPVDKPTEAGATSTLNTTAKDYALFVEAVLNRKGLKPETCAKWRRRNLRGPGMQNLHQAPAHPIIEKSALGFGMGIQRTDRGEAIWPWGDNGVFKCFVVAEPGTKSAAIMFSNGQNGLNMAEPLIDQAMAMESPVFAWLK